MITSKDDDKMTKTGCRNNQLGQEKELSVYVWTLCEACAHEEDIMKQTKTSERYQWDIMKDRLMCRATY